MDAAFTPPLHDKRVFHLDIGDRMVWCKRSTPPHAAWRYRALALLARFADLPLLRPVPKPGGHASLAIEKYRLGKLAAAGIRVPEVVMASRDWLLLGDIGESLRPLLRRAMPARRRVIAAQAIDAVKAVHAKGQYLSQAFERNLCLHDGRIGFIDFEDDPGGVFTLPEAQARDLLLLLNSLAAHFEEDREGFQVLCAKALDDRPAEQQELLKKTLSGLQRLIRRLPGAGRIRDVRRLLLLSDCVV